MVKEITVLVDTREKRPLVFPDRIAVCDMGKTRWITVHTKKECLPAGDYAIQEAPGLCGVERKGSARELWNNLIGSDAERQSRAFWNLSRAVEHPYLLVHTSAADLLTSSEHVPEPEWFIDRLMRAVSRFGFSLLLVPNGSSPAAKRIAGTLVAHLFVGMLEESEWRQSHPPKSKDAGVSNASQESSPTRNA